jgi:hypothetical protein
MTPGASFPPPGPSGRFPDFHGTKRPSDSRRPAGRARLPLTQPYRLCARPVRSCGLWAPPWPQAWIFGLPGPSPARSSAEIAGSPRFLGDPGGRMPCSLTPVGLPTPGQYSAGVLSPPFP